MPDNKRQHYVPKYALRHFACDKGQKQINIIYIKKSKRILRASLRDQCYRDYFYGEPLGMEKGLAKLEGFFSNLIRTIISSNQIDPQDNFHFSMMFTLQRVRTLRAEAEMNSMMDKVAKLLMINEFDESILRKVRIEPQGTASIIVGEALMWGPIIVDLKPFLLVNETNVPFVLSDNPVVATNWFCRSRLPGRQAGGMARAGLQMMLPISPRHAILLHDNNVYSTDNPSHVISIKRQEIIEGLNELQWLNAHRNIYFSPDFSDGQVAKLLAVERGSEALSQMRRLENVGEPDRFRLTDKDEFALPNAGVTSEILHFSKREPPKDIHVSSVRIRPKPRYYDDGSLGSPIRDPAWYQIVEDFVSFLKAGKYSIVDLWAFAARHPQASKVGPWFARSHRRAAARAKSKRENL